MTNVTKQTLESGEAIYTTPSGERAFRMDAANYATLADKLVSLNKKAAKLKVEPVSYDVVEKEQGTVSLPTFGEAFDGAIVITGYRTVERTFYYVVVRGGFPHLDGWHFVATIEPTEAGNILKAVPGETVPAQYREATNYCDHCKSSRYRLATFILRHDDGRTAQVGRNCLANYLGSERTPAQLAKLAEFGALVRDPELGSDEDAYLSGGRRYPEQVDTIEFLATVASLARFRGFVTRKMVECGNGSSPTGSDAWTAMTWAKFEVELRKNGWDGVEDRDLDTAKAARAWAMSLGDANDFERNMRIAATLDAIDYRQVGIAAYVVEGYRRATEQKIEAEVVATGPRIEPRHVGQIGERVVLQELKVARVHEFESDFGGAWYLVRFLDNDGNTIVWKSGTGTAASFEQDEIVTVKATIKDHSFYRDTPQTILTRVAVV